MTEKHEGVSIHLNKNEKQSLVHQNAEMNMQKTEWQWNL